MEEGFCRICMNNKNCSSLYELVLERYYLPTVIKYVCGVQISSLDEPDARSCTECALAFVQAEAIIKKFRYSNYRLQLQQELKIEEADLEKEPPTLELKQPQDIKQRCRDTNDEHKEASFKQIIEQQEEENRVGLDEVVKIEDDVIQKEEEDTDSNESTCENNVHDAEPQRTRQKRTVNRQKEFDFSCDFCDYETKFAKYFRNHLIQIHKIEKPRIFKCNYCSEMYMAHRTMLDHVGRVHERHPFSQSRPFLCSDCGKGFKKNSHLVRHSFVHRPEERPLQCEFCPMTFVNLHSLQRHMNSAHSEEKSFVCEHCGKAFGCVYNLRAHKKRLHSGIQRNTNECSLCKASFRFVKSLKIHQLNGCGNKPRKIRNKKKNCS